MAPSSRSGGAPFSGILFKWVSAVSLKRVCLAGLGLSLLLGGLLILAVLRSGESFFTPEKAGEEDSFYRDLRDYDVFSAGRQENPETLLLRLDRLEKKALGVESHLAVLKRRRALAFGNPRFYSSYQGAAQRSAAAFPYSQPLAAIALEALFREGAEINGERAELAADYAGRISETRFMPLVLACHILSGAMKDPARAAALPNREILFTLALPFLTGESSSGKNEGLLMDLVILRALAGDLAGAGAGLNDLLRPSPGGEPAAAKIRRFGAEFFYDYGNPRRAAELLTPFSDAESLALQGDALWLAEIPGGARNIWTVLAAPSRPEQAGTPPEIRTRSLYNLAATAPDKTEEASWLNRLLAEGRRQTPAGQGESAYVYGIIRYTRLLDGPRAQAILEDGELRNHPLLDLELLRRRQETWPVDRMVAETWLLLGRHPEDEGLYQWAAYFFDYQRRYEETAQALKNAGYQGLDGYWAELHRALALLREGRFDEGEELLQTIPPSAGIWQAPANIGRLLEARRASAAALEYYETAASLVKNSRAAAGVQLRIAQCLRALGRDRESRRVLEYALDLDPENLNARLELRRLESLGL